MSIHVSHALYAQCPQVQPADATHPEIISRFGQHLVVEAVGRTVVGCRPVTVADYAPATEAALRATADPIPKPTAPAFRRSGFRPSRSWSRR